MEGLGRIPDRGDGLALCYQCGAIVSGGKPMQGAVGFSLCGPCTRERERGYGQDAQAPNVKGRKTRAWQEHKAGFRRKLRAMSYRAGELYLLAVQGYTSGDGYSEYTAAKGREAIGEPALGA